MNGVLFINKEKGYTSRDVVNIISKHLKVKKVGHTGTLDPMATGVLIVCVGSATKLVDIITNEDKEYIAEITLGIETDTLDITGNIIKEEKVKIPKEKIIEVINSMKGSYNQEVPMYSAIKIDGKRLYEYARNKEKIDLPKRLVNIKEINLIDDIKYINDKTIFKIKCLVSKGTYIRSLVRDIASKLNTIGVMSELIRTKQGHVKVEDCYNLDDIINNRYQLTNIKDILPHIKQVIIDEKLEKDILNGKIIDNIYDTEKILFLDKNNNALALYQSYEKRKNMLKPWKMFKVK
ncbi:MAG: tRNA pseudouridine(55) synthase TruB [Mollicutes bacterium]|nr:tRNA pseudouridine(55) synthase TruB [Mollicutes bacterium]